MPNQILNVQGLETKFRTDEGTVHAINGVSFTVNEGETIGIVGESGSGKSVTMLSVLRLIPIASWKDHSRNSRVPWSGFAQDGR